MRLKRISLLALMSLVVAGGVLLLVGLLRDDEKEPTA